jgi:hypothetical protein
MIVGVIVFPFSMNFSETGVRTWVEFLILDQLSEASIGCAY